MTYTTESVEVGSGGTSARRPQEEPFRWPIRRSSVDSARHRESADVPEDADLSTSSASHRSDPIEPTVSVTSRWFGVVTDVDDQGFRGQVVPAGGGGPEVMADFERAVLSVDDEELLEVGAWFYVNVGIQKLRGGRRSRVSAVRFKRLPAWSQEDIDYLTERARKNRQSHGLDDT